MEYTTTEVFIHRLMGITLVYGDFQAALASWVIGLLEARFCERLAVIHRVILQCRI